MNNFRLKEERARFEAGERQELEARLAPAKKELAASLQRADKMTRMFWSQPLKHLGGLISQGSFEPDPAVTFPTTDEPQSGSRGRAECAEFIHGTLPRRGFILAGSGQQRLTLYTVAQAMAQRADLANPETWQTAFDRLYRLEAFDEKAGEVGYDESQREIVPERVVEHKPTLEELNLSTRAGEKAGKALVAREVFVDGEASKVFHEFVAHVQKTFGHTLTADEQYEIVSLFQKNNWSFLTGKNYDTARVNLVRRGLLPQTCQTEDELLCQKIDQAGDTRSYEGRRSLLQQVAASRNRS